MKSFITRLSMAAIVAVVPAIASAASVELTAVRSTTAYLAVAAPQAGNAADEAISAKVKALIDADADAKGSDITVTTASGVVTLKGVATSAVARLKIVEKTQATEGVTKVVNKVTIAKKK